MLSLTYQIYIYETMLEFKQKHDFVMWNDTIARSSAL